MAAPFEHLSVVGTEQQILVQRQHNRCGWTQSFQRMNDINAEVEVVMQVDDLGFDCFQQRRELLVPLFWIKALQCQGMARTCDC